MRFLKSKKVLIVLLYFLNVNLFKISKIIYSYRKNDSLDDILIKFCSNDNLINVLKSFKLKFFAERNKPTSRNAVKKVVDKWLKTSSIENLNRSNYNTAISKERIKFLCAFVKKNNKNRKLTLKNLKLILKSTCLSINY